MTQPEHISGPIARELDRIRKAMVLKRMKAKRPKANNPLPLRVNRDGGGV